LTKARAQPWRAAAETGMAAHALANPRAGPQRPAFADFHLIY
jgi:hypothetical protein